MQSYKSNSIKHNFFRAIAMVVILCYILGPAKIQLNSILHTISHSLKAPSYVLQHNEVDNSNYINQISSEAKMANYNYNHQHEIIDALDVIFDAASNKGEDHQGESTIFDIKINKHITSNKYALVFQNTYLIDQPTFWETNVYPKVGYLDELYRPPKA